MRAQALSDFCVYKPWTFVSPDPTGLLLVASGVVELRFLLLGASWAFCALCCLEQDLFM